MGSPVESVTAYMWHVLVLLNKSVNLLMLFWKLAVPSKSQWWVGWGNFTLEGLVPLSASPHWLSTNLVCACKRRNISTTVHAVKKIFRTSRFPVKLNLTYMTQRLLYPVFLVSGASLHFCMFLCKFKASCYWLHMWSVFNFIIHLDYRKLMIL